MVTHDEATKPLSHKRASSNKLSLTSRGSAASLLSKSGSRTTMIMTRSASRNAAKSMLASAGGVKSSTSMGKLNSTHDLMKQVRSKARLAAAAGPSSAASKHQNINLLKSFARDASQQQPSQQSNQMNLDESEESTHNAVWGAVPASTSTARLSRMLDIPTAAAAASNNSAGTASNLSKRQESVSTLINLSSLKLQSNNNLLLFNARQRFAKSNRPGFLPESSSSRPRGVAMQSSNFLLPECDDVPEEEFAGPGMAHMRTQRLSEWSNEDDEDEDNVLESKGGSKRKSSLNSKTLLSSSSSSGAAAGPRTRSSTTKAAGAKPDGAWLEVQPGVRAKLRGAYETWSYLQRDYYLSTSCGSCSAALCCIRNVGHVLCPTCRQVTSTEAAAQAAGVSLEERDVSTVGMGLTLEDVQQWETETGHKTHLSRKNMSSLMC